MLYSMLIRLAMLAVTVGVLFWIGSTLPTSRYLESDETTNVEQQDTDSLRAIEPAPPSGTTRKAPHQPAPAASSRSSMARMLDLNVASERDLQGLPGIGSILAGRIVEYRETRGAFRDVEQLRRVKGIGKKTFERIRALIEVTSSHTMQRTRKAA